ncbi:MAG: NUDIX hydrolase [Acidimicrobiia bacterium]|nr:NUDIX hydrolase [Acidimicrobiia bacterium]
MPAATVVLLRDRPGGAPPETLMLRKNAGQAFGGMWVFPGGKVEAADVEAAGPGADEQGVARQAAVREAAEETGVVLPPDALVPFSHWIPPESTPKRFSTWFFVAALPAGAADVVVDGGEIGDHVWTDAAGALFRHAEGAIELVPPTWVTLQAVATWPSAAAALDIATTSPLSYFATKVVDLDGGIGILWAGDAGYDTADPLVAGARHRLHMPESGWRYERS